MPAAARALPRKVLRNVAGRIPAVARLRRDRDELLRQRDALALELALGLGSSRHSTRFLGYDAVFDAEEVIRRHAVPDPQPREGHYVNFLGVAIDPAFYPNILAGHGGKVEGLPLPANWHADMAEWGACLRAVDLAREKFVVVELGCGWGCWLNNTGAAARRAGLRVRLLGVEGDRGHIGFAEAATATNGFDARDVTLHHGIAAASGGVALFPRQNRAGETWDLAPRFGATAPEVERALASGKWEAAPMLPLSAIAGDEARIDLLHVDIQGGEDDLVDGAIDFIRERVAYLVVGTHSRQIEGRIMDRLGRAGFVLEIERPAFLAARNLLDGVAVDGVQGWRNPALLRL